MEALEERIAMSLGGESLVNSRTTNDQFEVASASSSGGRSVVVWTDRFSSTDTDIKAQRYDSSGNKIGGELVINNSSGTLDGQPAVAMDSFGDFVVTWTRSFSGGDKDVLAARFNSSGTNRAGANRTISVASSSKPEYEPKVAVNSGGDFVVSYTLDFTASDQDVVAKMYRDSGSFVRTIDVASSGSEDERRSSVSRAPDGRFAIAYQTDLSSSDSDIKLKRYSSSGTLVNTHSIAVDTTRERNPSVAMDQNGNSVVVFEKLVGSDYDVMARRVSNTGSRGSTLTVQATTSHELNPVVAVHPTNGRFVVSYITRPTGSSSLSDRVHVREMTGGGSVLGTFEASSTSNRRTRPAISMDGSGRYLLAYQSVSTATSTRLDAYRRFGRI